MTSYKYIPDLVLISSFVIVIGALFSEYFYELTSAVLVLNLLFYYFWRPGHPPVVLGAFLYIWLSITLGYFYTVFLGGDILELLWHPYYSLDNIDKAYWYSLSGLIALSSGFKLAAGKTLNYKIEAVEIEKLNILKLLLAFLIYSPTIEFLFSKTRVLIPGISQFFHILRPFKWSFFFLSAVAVFQTKRMTGLFWSFFIINLLLSFTNYFAAFKPYFFILPIAFLSVRTLSYKQIIYLITIGILVFYLGVFWSYVKGDYRQFLSGGKNAQVVVVSKTEALKKIFSYTKTFDKTRFKYGREALFKRIFYLEFFSATIRMYPLYRDYTHGQNLMRAIRHVTMPRFLFPNKPALDDSKHTIELTGIYVASAKQGTSISVGYMSELYADFGPLGMNIPLFVLGMLWGLIYRFIMTQIKPSIWAFAFSIPMFFIMYLYERDLVKLVGDTLWFLIAIIFLKFTIVPWLDKFFRIKQNSL